VENPYGRIECLMVHLYQNGKFVVDAGKECGLEWAGDWKSFKEEAHFQYTGGKTIAQLQSGQEIV